MAEYIERGIRKFVPDDTEDTMYQQYGCTLDMLIEMARDKWGADLELTKVNITAEHIQTDCLGYDRYDSSDYTDYVVLTYEG